MQLEGIGIALKKVKLKESKRLWLKGSKIGLMEPDFSAGLLLPVVILDRIFTTYESSAFCSTTSISIGGSSLTSDLSQSHSEEVKIVIGWNRE